MNAHAHTRYAHIEQIVGDKSIIANDRVVIDVRVHDALTTFIMVRLSNTKIRINEAWLVD